MRAIFTRADPVLAALALLSACPPAGPGDDASDDDSGSASDEVRFSGVPQLPAALPAAFGVGRWDDWGMTAFLTAGRDVDCDSFAAYLVAWKQAWDALQQGQITQDEYEAQALLAFLDFHGPGSAVLVAVQGYGDPDDEVPLAAGPWPVLLALTAGMAPAEVTGPPFSYTEQGLSWSLAAPFDGEVLAWGQGRLRGWFETSGTWEGGPVDGQEVSLRVEVDVPVCAE